MDIEIKARIKPKKHDEIMRFCARHRLTRSDLIRDLLGLDQEYFEHIKHLNDPKIKQLIFHALNIAGVVQ